MTGPGGFSRDVAVKVLHRGAEALRREARIGGLLRHRHLVDVYEINEEDGQWFAAMEFCEGGLPDRPPAAAAGGGGGGGLAGV
jgi:serine/threonine protein kinase